MKRSDFVKAAGPAMLLLLGFRPRDKKMGGLDVDESDDAITVSVDKPIVIRTKNKDYKRDLVKWRAQNKGQKGHVLGLEPKEWNDTIIIGHEI